MLIPSAARTFGSASAFISKGNLFLRKFLNICRCCWNGALLC